MLSCLWNRLIQKNNIFRGNTVVIIDKIYLMARGLATYVIWATVHAHYFTCWWRWAKFVIFWLSEIRKIREIVDRMKRRRLIRLFDNRWRWRRDCFNFKQKTLLTGLSEVTFWQNFLPKSWFWFFKLTFGFSKLKIYLSMFSRNYKRNLKIIV